MALRSRAPCITGCGDEMRLPFHGVLHVEAVRPALPPASESMRSVVPATYLVLGP